MASESFSGPLQARSVKAHKFTAHPHTPLPIFLRRVLVRSPGPSPGSVYGNNENGEKKTMGLITKRATLHVQRTFFLHFFAVVLHDFNVELLETSWLYV